MIRSEWHVAIRLLNIIRVNWRVRPSSSAVSTMYMYMDYRGGEQIEICIRPILHDTSNFRIILRSSYPTCLASTSTCIWSTCVVNHNETHDSKTRKLSTPEFANYRTPSIQVGAKQKYSRLRVSPIVPSSTLLSSRSPNQECVIIETQLMPEKTLKSLWCQNRLKQVRKDPTEAFHFQRKYKGHNKWQSRTWNKIIGHEVRVDSPDSVRVFLYLGEGISWNVHAYSYRTHSS